MYTLVLLLHSWLRWAALVAGVGATMAAFSDREQTPAGLGRADRWGLALMAALDLQMLLGLLLYLVLSPTMEAIRQNFGAAMQDRAARFWAVEHIATMLMAVILVHVGRVLARKAKTPEARRTRLLVCFGIATLAMIGATPWPGMSNGRPLFRF
jgi:hypothetical protein